MLPRPGISLDTITARIRALRDTVYQAPSPVDYALWVSSAENSLRECFVDIPIDRLYTERFWRLTTGPVSRVNEMLRNEQRDQYEWLTHIQDTTRAMTERFGSPLSTSAVLDTHVLLHAKSLHLIDWREKLGGGVVHLVVPLRVVDEMDEKKYARRDGLQNRARKRLALLSRYVDGDLMGMPTGISVDIVGWRDLDVGGVLRPPVPADVDILDTCEALRVYSGGSDVSLVTADYGMRLRAVERDLPVTVLDTDDMSASDDE